MMIKNYLALTKPGIIFGNAITAAGGFALAAQGRFDALLFLAMLVGLSLVIASACVCNNFIDRALDRKMARTKKRPLAQGTISVQNALLFALGLGVLGTSLLALGTNLLTALIALFGFIVYVFFYSISKLHTTHATLIGSIAGGVPPVVGYCAISHHLDTAALILFTIVALWQMPHFFAIALYRLDDYAAAKVPVLPLKRGIRAAKIQMLFYVVAFIGATLMLTFLGYTGTLFLAVMGLLSLGWLLLSIQGFKSLNDRAWARTMFRFSLVIITALCAIIPFDTRPSPVKSFLSQK
jgi:heme o synthase